MADPFGFPFNEQLGVPQQPEERLPLMSPTVQPGVAGLLPGSADQVVTGQAVSPFYQPKPLEPVAGLSGISAARSFEELSAATAPRAPSASLAYNPVSDQYYINGRVINAANALEVEEGAKFIGQGGPALPPGAPNWQPISEYTYRNYLETLKKPRTVSEDIALGAKSLAAGAVAGAGRVAQIAGATEAGPAIAKFAEERIGPTKEEQARTALINQSNSFWQNVLDASAQGSSSLAASLIGGVGGFLVGGPIGAGVGAGLVSFLPNISAMWDAAKQNKYDENDPGVQAQIIGGALGVAALDAIPIGRGAKHIFSPAVKEAAEKAGQNVFRRALTGARRDSAEEAAEAVGQSVFRRALTGARRGSAEEAVTEAMQEIVQSVWFDPQVWSKLSQGDIAALAPYVAQNYGREALVAGGAGAILGGIFGGGVGAIAGRRGVDTGEPTNVLADAGATMVSLLSPFDALPPANPSGGIRYAPPLPGAQPGFTQLYPELTPQGAAAPAVAIPGITEDFPIGPSRGLPPPTQPLLLPPPPALPTAVSAPAIPMGGPPPVSGPVIYVPPFQEERATRGADTREAPLVQQTAPPVVPPVVPQTAPPPTVQTPTEVVTAATEGVVPPQAAPVAPVTEAGPVPVPPAAAVPVVETPAAPQPTPAATTDVNKLVPKGESLKKDRKAKAAALTPKWDRGNFIFMGQARIEVTDRGIGYKELGGKSTLFYPDEGKFGNRGGEGRVSQMEERGVPKFLQPIFRDYLSGNIKKLDFDAIIGRLNDVLNTYVEGEPTAQAQPETQTAPVTTAPEAQAPAEKKASTGRKGAFKAGAVKPEEAAPTTEAPGKAKLQKGKAAAERAPTREETARAVAELGIRAAAEFLADYKNDAEENQRSAEKARTAESAKFFAEIARDYVRLADIAVTRVNAAFAKLSEDNQKEVKGEVDAALKIAADVEAAAVAAEKAVVEKATPTPVKREEAPGKTKLKKGKAAAKKAPAEKAAPTPVKPEVKEARAPRAPAPTVAPAAQPAPAAAEPTTRPQMTSAGTLVRGIGKIDAKLVAYTKDLVEMTALRARDVVVLSMDDIGLVRDTVLPQTNDDAYVATAVVNGRPTHFVVINDARKFTARKTLELTAHEVGHIVQDDGFATAPTKVRDAISTDYNRHVARYGNKTVREFVRATFPTERAITYIADGDPATLNQTLNQISTTNRELYDYLAGSQGFSEWFANQVSRWATTTKKPLTIVEKFFADLGRMLRRVYEGLTSKAADDGLPVESMREFLDNLTPPVISQTVPPAPPKGAPRVQAAQAAEARAAVEPTPNTPDRIIDYTNKNLGFLPGPIREASQNVAINLLEAAKRGVYGMSFGNDLISQVTKHLPSARQFFDVLTTASSVVNEANEARRNIYGDLDALKIPQRREVFKIGLSQTSRGKWGYEPTWLKGKLDAKGNPIEIKIDPVAKAEWDKFKAANPKGAAVLDRMFEHMYNLDQRLRTTVRSLVEADLTTEEYNALSPEDKVKRRADVATRLKMFDVYGRIQGPYLPMSRFGEYIVVARSKQLQALEAIPIADRSKEEAKQLAEMRKDADHYDVRFFPSKATAVKARREIQAAYPDHDVVDFNKISEIKNLKDEASRTLLTLRAALKENVGTTEEAKKAEAALDDAIMSLYVRGLAESSARRRKLPREGVAGVNPDDMPLSFDLGSQSLASFIDNMTKSSELAPILEQLRKEASVMGDSQKALNDKRRAEGLPADMQVTSSRDDRTRAMRELMLRHVDGVAQPPTGRLTEAITTATATYLLTTLPRYYILNGTQPAMMTQPKLAARFGQGASWTAMKHAYQGMLQSIKTDEGGFYSGKFDITKLKAYDPLTKTYKNISGGLLAAIEAARDRSLLDVGLGLELAHFRSHGFDAASATFNKVMHKLTNLSRRVEYTNRVVTVVASFNLKMAQLLKDNPNIDPKVAEKQAIDYAIEMLRTTQGDPTRENMPRYFSKVPGGKVILQFRTFQVLQASEIIRHAYNMFKHADPQERQIARAALGYLMLNTAVMSGAVGIPGVALAAYILGAAFGDDEDLKYSVGSYTSRGERALREALGDNAIANILIKGIPTGFGIDVGAQLGMGNTFSLLPYTDMDLSSKEGYNKMVVGMLGPFASIGSNFADGFGMIHRGDYWKGTELMLPTGFRAAMRAYRETYADGVTTRAGDQLVSPEEFNFLKTVVNGLGIPTTDMQKIRDTRRDIYDFDVYFKDRTSTLRRQFVEARKDRDVAAQEDIKGQWRELQAAKQRVGFKPTPLSSLLLAPTEQARREKRGQEQFRRVQEAQ